MTDQNRPTVLITTLGAEAQIVPICIQLLARRGIEIDLVQVLHTNPAPQPDSGSTGPSPGPLRGRNGIAAAGTDLCLVRRRTDTGPALISPNQFGS